MFWPCCVFSVVETGTIYSSAVFKMTVYNESIRVSLYLTHLSNSMQLSSKFFKIAKYMLKKHRETAWRINSKTHRQTIQHKEYMISGTLCGYRCLIWLIAGHSLPVLYLSQVTMYSRAYRLSVVMSSTKSDLLWWVHQDLRARSDPDLILCSLLQYPKSYRWISYTSKNFSLEWKF